MPRTIDDISCQAMGHEPDARQATLPTAGLAALCLDDLKRLAAAHLSYERANHTLQRTDLVDEVCLRLLHQGGTGWETKAHFLVAASATIRRILIEHARRRGSCKRGGGWRRVPLQAELVDGEFRTEELLDLDAALTELKALSPRLALVVELKYFGGLSEARTAEMLDVSDRTVRKDWTLAKAWLHRRLRGEDPRGALG